MTEQEQIAQLKKDLVNLATFIDGLALKTDVIEADMSALTNTVLGIQADLDRVGDSPKKHL